MLGIESERFVIVGVYIKIGFLQSFTGGKRQQGVCATRILRHRLELIKSLAFFKALPRGREETMGYTVYGITSVLLLSLILGFLIVFREFGMISE